MSPLLRDDLRVVLSPRQVWLARAGWSFGRQGVRRRLGEDRTAPCAPLEAGQPAWSGALATLERQLHALPARAARLRVTLSNQFVRYAIVPWQAGLRGAAEEASYARHCFEQLFGDRAEGWDLRVSQAPPGQPRLASAIDARLLAALRRAAPARIALTSVRPQLMSTFNCHRRLFATGSGWLLLAESGCLCLALFEGGQWRSVRTMQAGPDWLDGLPALLERETCLADPGQDVEQVFLWALDLDGEPAPAAGRWRIQRLPGALGEGG